MIKSLTIEESELLVTIYSNDRKDDLIEFRLGNFVSACKNHIINAFEVLKEFVNSDKISVYDRCEAFKTIVEINPNKDFFERSVFYKYSSDSTNELFELAEVANEYLIDNFEDVRAIQCQTIKICFLNY
jgi:hypothetical protein